MRTYWRCMFVYAMMCGRVLSRSVYAMMCFQGEGGQQGGGEGR